MIQTKSIQQHILDYCHENDIAYKNFAKESGVSLNTLNEIIYARTFMPSDRVLRKLCKYMNISTVYVTPNYNAIRYTDVHVKAWIKEVVIDENDVEVFQNPDFASAFEGIIFIGDTARAVYNYNNMIDFLTKYNDISIHEAFNIVDEIERLVTPTSPLVIHSTRGDKDWYAIKRNTSLQK